MPEVHRVSVEIGGTEISFETGWMAKQASGAVVVRGTVIPDGETWAGVPARRISSRRDTVARMPS